MVYTKPMKFLTEEKVLLQGIVEKIRENRYAIFYVLLWLIPLVLMIIRGNL